MDRFTIARKHYWASCGLLAKKLNTTKEAINNSVKDSMKVKSHRDIPEDQLRDLSAAMTAMAMEE